MNQQSVHVDRLVGQQAVHLLDGMLGEAAARQCEALNGMDRQIPYDWVHRYNAASLAGWRSHCSPGRPPAPIGSHPSMVRDNRHDPVSLFGAICHARVMRAAIIKPTVNIKAMNEHLKEISTQISPGAHAVLVCDRAGWHQPGKRLRTPHNITLLPLPPYAPDLNPVENIWVSLRGNQLSRRAWDSYDAIIAAGKDAWHCLIGDPERFGSSTHRSWAWGNL